MRLLSIALVAIAASLACQAQAKVPARKKAAPTAPAAQTARAGVPLVAIEFTGNKVYNRDRLVAATGLKIGQLVQKEDFDIMRERLLGSGALEAVGYEYKVSPDGRGYVLAVEVREFEPVLEFFFEELPAPDADIRASLKTAEPLFDSRIPSNKPVLDRFASQILAFLTKKGFNDTVVWKVIADAPDSLKVRFRPGTEPLRVAQTKFIGEKAIDNGLLTRTFNGVAIGAVCKEPALRTLLESGLRPLYESRGFLRVAFPKVSITKMKDVEGCEVLVAVEEGPAFKYGELQVAGAGMSPADMLKITELKAGETANFDSVKAGEKAILAALKAKGYMRATVKSDRIVQDKTKTVDVTYRLTAGDQYKFGRLNIKGLDIQNEPPTRKMWGLKPATTYRADYPQYFLDQIRDQGMFDNLKQTRYEEKLDDNEKIVDVTLYFNQ